MNENNAAQPGLTDDEREHLFARYFSHDHPCRRDINALTKDVESALLSKLRADGVQAGDERALFEKWARKQPAYIVKDLGRRPHPNSDQYGHATAQIAWAIWQDARAALVSASVAGEVFKDECAATGQTCSYGQRQCSYCGAAPPASKRGRLPDLDQLK